MSAVITHARRRSRLSKIIDEAGGVSIGAALAQARANLDALRPRSLDEIEARIAEMAAIAPPSEGGDEQAALGAVYRLANAVIDSAGPFELDDVCFAAAGLCDVVDAASPQRPFDWRVVPVFAQSLRLLTTLPVDERAQRDAVRAELDRLIDQKLGRTG